MARPQQQCIPECEFLDPLSELKQVVPEACRQHDLILGIVEVINQHLKPLEDPKAQNARIAQLITRYAKVLRHRVPDKRPKTKAGALKSLEAFVTKDIRATAREYADFEARAERLLIENPAMHLTARGIERHVQRALDILARFMIVLAEQNEHLGRFRTQLQKLENEYFDRDDWALHLHDRLNRLANLLTAIDAAATSLKRTVLAGRPFIEALESLRALRDDSLNPLEFIGKVFAGHDHPYAIEFSAPDPPITYSNHFLVREILMELVHNAVANNASSIRLSLVSKNDISATIAVEDNCPGGMSRDIIDRIGKERIIDGRIHDAVDLYGGKSLSRGWGLYALFNNMVPRLGEGAAIEFFSPLTPEGGTRVLLTVPIVHKVSHQATISCAPCAFRSMDPFMASGRAVNDAQLVAYVELPLNAKTVA